MLQRLGKLIKGRVPVARVPKSSQLKGHHAAILATDGFEEQELLIPRSALDNCGCETHIISLYQSKIRAWRGDHWGKTVNVDFSIAETGDLQFDFLVIPGGILSIDKLRTDQAVISFVKYFLRKKRPIAAISHGPQLLIETDLIEGRTLTSSPSIKTDLINAGANWANKEVIVDHKVITSRFYSDFPSFLPEMIRVFELGKIRDAIPDVESFIYVR